MPTYQYACTACDERLEAVQSFTDAPLTECPACGGALRKVFSAVGVVFKGSGFYKTDSRSTASGNGSKADGKGDGATSDGGKSDGGKSDGSAAKVDSGANSGDKAGGSSSRESSSAKPAAAAAAGKTA